MSFNPALSFAQGFESGDRMKERQREREMQSILERVSGDNDPMANNEFSKLPINVQNGFRQAATLQAGLSEKQEDQRYNAMIRDFRLAKGLANSGYEKETVDLLRDRAANSQTPVNTNRLLEAYEQGGMPELTKMLNVFDEAVTGGGMPSSTTASFNDMVKQAGLSKQDAVKAARIKLGLDPRAVGSSIQTIADSPEKTNAVAQAEAIITGRKKEAELISRMNIEPELQGKLKDAVAQSAQNAKLSADKRTNDKSLALYQNSIQSLGEALLGTSTGNLSGLLPALTTEAKTAEGAISIMRVVLKDMVRGAGEGTFTDSDQKVIDGLMPTRSDTPDSIKRKLEMLDSFVFGKLGMNQPEGAAEVQGNQNSPLSTMDAQAMQWANANPNDPRAAAIKQRLGAQ